MMARHQRWFLLVSSVQVSMKLQSAMLSLFLPFSSSLFTRVDSSDKSACNNTQSPETELSVKRRTSLLV